MKQGSTTLAAFTYDEDGQRVKRVVGSVTTVTIGDFFEWTGSSLNWILTDHLGSTSVVTDANGTLHSKQLYKPWGEMRFSSGTLPTDYKYTGQREAPGLGIYFYNARWFDPVLGRFLQADSIVPGAGNPLAWDRYAYSRNNPINYNDPDGHCPLLVTALIGASIAAGVDYVYQVIDNVSSGQELDQALVSVDVAEIAGAAVAGGIAGATLGLGTAALAAVGGTAATTSLLAVPVAAVAGGVGNAVGGQAGALTEAGIRQIGNDEFNRDQFYNDAFEAGFLNADDFVWDMGSGAILGAGGQAFSNLSAPPTAVKYQFYGQTKDLEGNIIPIPQFNSARFPGQPIRPVLDGTVAGFMRQTSDITQEFINQGLDRYIAR